MSAEMDFHGAKLALFIENNILVYRRDNNPAIPFPDMLDLPGGGRENGESGAECVVRETFEEFGITLDPDALEYVEQYPNWRGTGKQALFFVGQISKNQLNQIVFGDEGQGWQIMRIQEYLSRDDAVPHLQKRVAAYIEAL